MDKSISHLCLYPFKCGPDICFGYSEIFSGSFSFSGSFKMEFLDYECLEGRGLNYQRLIHCNTITFVSEK